MGGVGLIWIPASASVPPFFNAFRAAGIISPAGAKIIAASSLTGGSASVPPAHSAPSSMASFWCRSSRVEAYTFTPQWGATWMATWAAEPKRTEADDARAQQRRCLLIGKSVGNGIGELFGCQRVFGVAAIDGIAG